MTCGLPPTFSPNKIIHACNPPVSKAFLSIDLSIPALDILFFIESIEDLLCSSLLASLSVDFDIKLISLVNLVILALSSHNFVTNFCKSVNCLMRYEHL